MTNQIDRVGSCSFETSTKQEKKTNSNGCGKIDMVLFNERSDNTCKQKEVNEKNEYPVSVRYLKVKKR